MTKMITVYKGNLRTEITHQQSGTKVITDAPLDNHGKGESFSPTDLFASSLGSCMLTIMGITAQTHGFNIDGTTLTTEKIMGTDPRRVVEIVINFKFPEGAEYSPKEKKLIEAAAKSCPVGNSLHPDIKKTINFGW